MMLRRMLHTPGRRATWMCLHNNALPAAGRGSRGCSTMRSLYLWPSMNQWPTLQVTAGLDIVAQIDKANTQPELCDLLNEPQNRQQFEKNGKLWTYFCRRLTFITYMKYNIAPYKPWVKPDIHVAFRQMHPLEIKQYSFMPWLSRDILTLENADLNEILLLLMYLGVSKHHVLLRDTYLMARRHVQHSSWNSIANLLRVGFVMGPADHNLYSAILNRMKNDLQSGVITSSDACDLLTAVDALPVLFSTNMCHLLTMEINRCVTDTEVLNSGHTVTVWTRAVAKIYESCDVKAQLKLEQSLLQLDKVIERKDKRVRFTRHQIGQMMRDVQFLYPYSAPPLFSSHHRISEDLTDLLMAAAYWKYYDNKTFTDKIYSRMYKQLAKPGMLSINPSVVDYELVCTVMSKGGIPADVRRKLLHFVKRGMHHMPSVPWDRLVVNREIRRPTDDYLLHNFATLLATPAVVTTQQKCVIIAFILANSYSKVAPVMKTLDGMLPNCSFRSLGILLKGLNVSVKLDVQVQPWQRTLRASVLTHLEAAISGDNNSQVCALPVYDLLVMFRLITMEVSPRDIQASGKIMEQILLHMHSGVTVAIQDSITWSLLNGNYYSPDVMEFLAASLPTLDVSNSHHARLVTHVLMLLARFRYTPRCMDDLQRVVWDIFRQAKSEKDWSVCTGILSNLSHLDIYPQHQLKEYFSAQTLQQTAQHKATLPLLCSLNSNVCVFRPELEIPFVCGEYVRRVQGDRCSTRDLQRLYDLLRTMLGGKQFVKRDVIKYDCCIDFEVAVRNSQLVPIGDPHYTPTTDKHALQRIAILLAKRNTTAAANDTELLLDTHFMRKRFLETLGYDVIILETDKSHLSRNKQLKPLKEYFLRVNADARKLDVIP